MIPDVSVIIVNFNTEDYLVECIGSVFEQTGSRQVEIIVVDNASDVDPSAKITAIYPHVRMIRNTMNRGFGAANNTGAAEARGKFLFFLNPDTVLLNDSIGIFHRFMNSDNRTDRVVACGGNLVRSDKSPAPAWGNLPTLSLLFSDLGFRKLYKNYYESRLATNGYCNSQEDRPVPYIAGADLFIRKDIFLKLGGFSEQYFMYFEDADLGYRLKREGYKTYLLPEAKILHHESLSTRNGNGFNYRKYELLEKSKYLYFKKNHGFIAAHVAKDLQLISLLVYAIAHRLANVQLATSNPQPATRNPHPVTRNPHPVTSNPQPATRNLLKITLDA
ncbi:MAG: glycosyltransferase family 2 protein [Bacteroidales bacterium]|jgi:hypothetical protein